jgi:hypothetical protein
VKNDVAVVVWKLVKLLLANEDIIQETQEAILVSALNLF